jgi:5-methylcytosine-specific restriction enzyme A
VTLAAFKPCAHPCCPALVKSGMCEKHSKQQSQRQYEAKRRDEAWMLYQTPRWKTFRLWFLRLNPQCQRVIDGKQCEHIADTVHHLQSPRQRPDLFLDADNVKSVCRAHHHHGEGAGPDEVYVASNTKLSLESC